MKLRECFRLFESRDQQITQLDRIVKRIKVPAMIIGGAALPYYGYNRVTEDINIITNIEDAKKLGNELLKQGYKFIGQNKFMKSNLLINLCPTGVKAGGKSIFPPVESLVPGLIPASLPRLLALKVQANRAKDRGDYVELIKRNKLDWEYIEDKVIPLLDRVDMRWAKLLYDQAMEELICS